MRMSDWSSDVCSSDLGARAPGAADAVDVIVGMPGRVEIEDVADALDVEPARGDVGGDEDVDLTALEQIEFGEPLRLFHVAVDLAGLKTRALAALVQLAHGRIAVIGRAACR